MDKRVVDTKTKKTSASRYFQYSIEIIPCGSYLWSTYQCG